MVTDNIIYATTGQSNQFTGVNPGKYSSVSSVPVFTGTKTGGKRPDYKLLISKGISATNAYTATKPNQLSQGSCSISTRKKIGNAYQYAYGQGYVSRLGTGDYPGYLDADAMALTTIRKRIADEIDQFKALVPIGEINETRKLIRSTADSTRAVIQSLLDIRRGRGSLKEIVASASDAWLNFSFGISPTISDTNQLINSIGTALTRVNSGAYIRFQGQSPTIRSVKQIATGTTVYNTGHVRILVDEKCTSSVSVKYVAGIIPKIIGQNDYSISDHFGLTFGDIVGAGWELVPYSWVLDYFTTTGQFLGDTFTQDGFTTNWVSKTQRIEQIYSQSFRLDTVPKDVIVDHFTNVPGAYKVIGITRSDPGSLGIPPWRFKTMDEIGRNAVNRLLNLSALLLKH